MAGGSPGGREVGRISIRVVPNTSLFREELKAELDWCEKNLKGEVTVNANLDSAKALGDMGILMAKLKAEGAKGVSVNAKIDTKSFGKNGGLSLSKFMPSFGGGVNPAGMAAIFAGILAVAAPVLGLITTALLAIPGLLSLILAPIAAITLGLDGFKKAAEAIKPQFDHLKQVMSDVAQTAFTPVLQNLADTVFPALERALPSVTKGLASLAQGAVDAFNQPGKMATFEGSINRIGDALAGMKPGIQGFTSGFLGLVDQFTLKLPAISDWFNKSGADFDAWVAKISKDGSLSRAFDGLGSTIRKIIDWLAELGSKSIDFMGDPKSLDGFNESLKKVGEGIQSVIDLSAALNRNFQMLVQAWRPFSAIGDVLQGDLSGAWNTLKQLFNNESFTGAADQVNALKDSVNAANDAAAAAKVSVTDLLLAPGATPTPGSTGGPLGDLLASAPEVKPPDTAAAEAKVSEYQSFVDSITQQVRGSLEQATSGESLPAPNFEAFKTAWSGMVTFTTEQIGLLKAATANVGTDAAAGLSIAWSGLPAIATNAFGQVSNAATTALGTLVQAVVTKGGEVTAVIAAWPGQFVAALGDTSTLLDSAGRNIVQGLINGINAMQGSAVAAASTLAGAVAAAARGTLGIKSPSTVFHEIGGYVAEGLGNGLDEGFLSVIEQAKALSQQLTDAINGGLEGVNTDSLKDQLKQTQDRLTLQNDQLKVQLNGTDDKNTKDGIKDQRSQIQALKDQLKFQSDQVGFSTKQTDELKKQDDLMGSTASSMIDIGKGFATANYKSLASDLGITGNGAISSLADQGINYLTSTLSNLASGAMGGGTNIHVNSVDEALTAKQTIQNKQALQYSQR